jgi:AAA family ATP:ADP antiporter
MVVFYLLGRKGVDIGFAYYVWVGIFAVMVPTQFWAFAADSYNLDSGKRLFPVIMVGATVGSLMAPSLSGALFPILGPWVLMLAATALLAMTLPLVSRSRSAIPPPSRSPGEVLGARSDGGIFGGLALVFNNRFLFLLALLILLLNWVNTTGEYILAELVVRHAEAAVAADSTVDKSAFIAAFYGGFFFAVNLLTLLFQLFAVARVIQWIGVRGAILVLPLITLVGYGLVAFVPVFSVIRIVKLMENSTDYSLMNTARHALYLPLPRAHKYEGKTAIDGFFWRFGDLVQAGVIFAGLHWFNFDVTQFAALNMVLSMAWLVVAWRISQRFPTLKQRQVGEDYPANS